MCSCEWPGRLKCLATGLDRSDPLFLTSSKCPRKRSPNLRPDSPMTNVEFVAENTSDTINDIGGCAVEMVIDLVRSFGSLNVCFKINERTCVANLERAIESPRF